MGRVEDLGASLGKADSDLREVCIKQKDAKGVYFYFYFYFYFPHTQNGLAPCRLRRLKKVASITRLCFAT